MFLVNEPYRWVNVPGESHVSLQVMREHGPATLVRATFAARNRDVRVMARRMRCG